jgi:hypothetical protein
MFKTISKLFSRVNIVNNNIFQSVCDFNISDDMDIYTNMSKKKTITHINNIATKMFNDKTKNNIECELTKKYIFIDVFGNVFPCYYFFEINY